MLQNFTFALTSISTSARRRTSVGSAESRWKAMRCALLGPTPGSRPSSSMRSWTAPSYTSDARQAEAAGQRAHLLLGELRRGASGVAHGGGDEVLQRLDVSGVDDFGRDDDAGQLARPGHGGAHQPASGAALDLEVGELRLGAHELLLHLLGLLHELLHVGLRGHAVS